MNFCLNFRKYNLTWCININLNFLSIWYRVNLKENIYENGKHLKRNCWKEKKLAIKDGLKLRIFKIHVINNYAYLFNQMTFISGLKC